MAAKESFIGIQRVFCCQLHNLPLPVTESCIGSQRAFHRHSKSLSLPAKGSFIGNQTVIHRQLPTGRGLLCIFLKTPPRCGTRVTFLGHARQLITQKKCHSGEDGSCSIRSDGCGTMSLCGDVLPHVHVHATNIFCPEFHVEADAVCWRRSWLMVPPTFTADCR